MQLHDDDHPYFPTNNSVDVNGALNTGHCTPDLVATDRPAGVDMLSPQVVSELCKIWFERYHPWFPILHQPSLIEAIQSSPDPKSSSRSLVLQAIVAVTIGHSQVLPSTVSQRQQCSAQFSQSVWATATGNPSLDSVQALLILSTLNYGEGDILKSWNLLAICRRYYFLFPPCHQWRSETLSNPSPQANQQV
jgi:hypothetical protein